MQTTNNTILITGGSAGIGLEMARLFSAGNKVIIVGRNEQRLRQAAAGLKNTTAIAGDVSDAGDVERLVRTLYNEHPDLNIVINNAAGAYAYDLTAEGADAFTKASQEMLTNYLSIIRLNEKLLPLLRRQPEAAIVHVSSIVAIAPGGGIPTYSDSKAALHSYTLSLRHRLSTSTIRVFELMPPLVNTELSAGIGGSNGIPPSQVAQELLKGIAQDNFEIRVGRTEEFYRFYLSSPEQAILAMQNPQS